MEVTISKNQDTQSKDKPSEHISSSDPRLVANLSPNSLNKLVKYESIPSLVNDCQIILKDWVPFLRKVVLPPGSLSSDSHVLDIFRLLDSALTHKPGADPLSRLASVQLINHMSSLEDMVQSERKKGLINRMPGYGDASVVFDLYLRAQEGIQRRVLIERKRIAKRWAILSDHSPLLLLLYSEAVTSIVHDHRGIDNQTLTNLKTKILRECPPQALQVCLYVSGVVDSAVRSNSAGPDWLQNNSLLGSPWVRGMMGYSLFGSSQPTESANLFGVIGSTQHAQPTKSIFGNTRHPESTQPINLFGQPILNGLIGSLTPSDARDISSAPLIISETSPSSDMDREKTSRGKDIEMAQKQGQTVNRNSDKSYIRSSMSRQGCCAAARPVRRLNHRTRFPGYKHRSTRSTRPIHQRFVQQRRLQVVHHACCMSHKSESKRDKMNLLVSVLLKELMEVSQASRQKLEKARAGLPKESVKHGEGASGNSSKPQNQPYSTLHGNLDSLLDQPLFQSFKEACGLVDIDFP